MFLFSLARLLPAPRDKRQTRSCLLATRIAMVRVKGGGNNNAGDLRAAPAAVSLVPAPAPAGQRQEELRPRGEDGEASPAPAPAGQRLPAKNVVADLLYYPPAVFHNDEEKNVARTWLGAPDRHRTPRNQLQFDVCAARDVALRQLLLGVKDEKANPDDMVESKPMENPLAVLEDELTEFATAMLAFHRQVQDADVGQPLTKLWHKLARTWLVSCTVGHNAIGQMQQVKGRKRSTHNGNVLRKKWVIAVKLASQRTGIVRVPANLRRGQPL